MATETQIQQMLDLMQQQMTQMNNLQAENAKLRETENQTPAAANNGQTTYRSKKPDRPIVNAGIDDRDWALFKDTWSRYKTMINVVEADAIRLELRAACSEDVNKLLFEYVGSVALDTGSEEQLLEHIKSVAVKSVHKEVHRMAFNTMSQNTGEAITNYVARLKAKAFLCQFEVTCCSTDHTTAIQVSYAEEMVAQRLIAGLANPEHQRRVLAEAPTLVTLNDKVRRLQILETTEESVTMLHTIPPPSEAAAARSSYKQMKRQPVNSGGKDGPPLKCRWCGRTSHPGGKPMDRVSCPAYKKECRKCHLMGHFAYVCEKSKADAATERDDVDEEASLLGQLPSEASVSFSFGAQTQDFRHGPETTGNT